MLILWWVLPWEGLLWSPFRRNTKNLPPGYISSSSSLQLKRKEPFEVLNNWHKIRLVYCFCFYIDRRKASVSAWNGGDYRRVPQICSWAVESGERKASTGWNEIFSEGQLSPSGGDGRPARAVPATPRAPPHLLLSSRPSLVYKEREAELEAFSANAPPLYTHSVWSVVLPTREAFFSMLTSVLELWYWNESRWLHYYLSKWRFSTFHWSNPRLSPHPAQLLDL